MRKRAMRTRRPPADPKPEAVTLGDLADQFLKPSRPARRPAGALRPTLLGALLIGATAWTGAYLAVDQRRAALDEETHLQAETVAEANAALLSARVAGLSQIARRITGSELVQVYAAGAAGPGEPSGWLADQAPFLTQLFKDFVGQHGLVAASLIAAQGDVILTVGELPEGPALPEGAGGGIGPVITPVYELVRDDGFGGGLAFDIVLPIPGLAESSQGSAPALLVMTLDASTLTEAVAEGELGAPVLTQDTGPDLRLPLGESTSGSARAVIEARVDGTPWLLEQPVGLARAGQALAAFERRAYGLAGGVATLLALAFGLFCSTSAGRRRREHEMSERAVAEQARRFGELFETVADRVSDGVGVKSPTGRYVYVNEALSERLGRPPEAVIGRTDEELLEPAAPGDAVADAMTAALDGRALVRTGDPVEGPAVVVVPQAARAEQPHRGGLPVTRAGQVTADQAVDLLVRAVELRDPFLRGHGERLAELAGAVARHMGLSDAERTTIEVAARLSQVGKIFIPDAILTKPGRHTEAEARIMRGHVEQTLELLDGIDLGLPVAFVLGQMHERLDGSGYPRGLSGDEIGLPARILGAVDVFCARTAPRAYREQISAGQALFHLAGHPERFDAQVVTALVGVFAESRKRSPLLLAADRADAA